MEDNKRSKYEINTRKSVSCSLNGFTFDNNDSYIELVQWPNAEGFDVNIANKYGKDLRFSLNLGELDAINYLKYVLDYE